MRPSELLVSGVNPRKAQANLGWKAKFVMKDVVRMMIESETLHLGMSSGHAIQNPLQRVGSHFLNLVKTSNASPSM